MPRSVTTDIKNLNTSDQEFQKDIRKEIKQVEKEEKEDLTVVDFSTFLSTFNIFQVALGTILGYAVNRLISDISSETLQPIVRKLLFYEFFDEINVFGMKFDIKNIISSVIYFVLIIVLLYFVFTKFFSNYIEQIVKDDKTEELTKFKNDLYSLLLQKNSYDTLKKIEESINSQNEILDSV